MVKIMMTVDNKLTQVDKTQVKKGCWLNLQAPDDRELEAVSKLTQVPLDMLKIALDEEERAHIEKEDGCTLVIVDTPIIEEDEFGDFQYSTLPLGIIYNADYFITVSLKECGVVSDFAEGRVRSFFTYKRVRNMLLLLQRNATKFLQYLKNVDKLSNRVQSELQKSMKNKELLQLMQLEKSLVYFATGLNANEYVLEKVLNFEDIKTYTEDVELLDDVITENKQAMEMCSIYSDILSGTMDAFASVVSNNLNILMKVFTMITIVLAIPTLVFSLWGMNVPLPFTDHPAGFWMVVVLAVVFSVLGTVIILRLNASLNRKSGKNKRKK